MQNFSATSTHSYSEMSTSAKSSSDMEMKQKQDQASSRRTIQSSLSYNDSEDEAFNTSPQNLMSKKGSLGQGSETIVIDGK
jgi:hypothetical protein